MSGPGFGDRLREPVRAEAQGGDDVVGLGLPRVGGEGERAPGDVYPTSEVTTRATITFKPEPGFTGKARSNNVSGVVRLRAVLGSDGTVRNISVIKGLPDGLTEKAVAAARKIKFKPATIDGRPVSQFVVLEYNFNIY